MITKTQNLYKEDTSLSSFDTFMNPPTPPADGGGGAGNPPPTPPVPPAPPDEAQVKADTEVLNTLLGKEALTTEEQAKLDELSKKYDIKKYDEDGKLIEEPNEADKAEIAKKIEAIKAKPENQRTLEEVKFLTDNTEKPVNLYEQVDELSGLPVVGDFGDLTPNTPEWIAKREEIIRNQAAKEYDETLKANYPLAYQLLLHQQNGGKVEDFLVANNEDYSKIELTKEDKAAQELWYRKALALKGFTGDQADLQVQGAKDKGKLFEFATLEVNNLKKQQLANQQAAETKRIALQNQEKAITTEFYTTLKTGLEKGIEGITIPIPDRKEFEKFVSEAVYIRDGKLIYYKELDKTNIQQELLAQYFRFKKGDLSKVVQRKAQSLNAQEKRKAVKIELTPKSGKQVAKEFVPMADV